MARNRLKQTQFRVRYVKRLLTKLEDAFMATAEELQSAVDSLSASLDDAKARIADDVTALEASIEELKAELADSIDPTSLNPIVERVASIRATVEGIDPVPPTAEQPPVSDGTTTETPPAPEETPPPSEGTEPTA